MEDLLETMKTDYAKKLLADNRWPDGVRKEFMSNLHQFMAFLNVSTYEARGQDFGSNVVIGGNPGDAGGSTSGPPQGPVGGPLPPAPPPPQGPVGGPPPPSPSPPPSGGDGGGGDDDNQQTKPPC